MYTFRQFGRNDLKLFWIFARKRAKFSSAFRTNCLWRCQNKRCGLLPMYLPRNTACVWDIEASEYSEEFQKRHVPLLLSSGVALILALCSERSKGRFFNWCMTLNIQSLFRNMFVFSDMAS